MRKLLFSIIISVLAMADFAVADLSMTFDDEIGTPNALSISTSASAQQFTFDVFVSYTNTGSPAVPNVAANDYWLHGGSNVSNFFSIVSRNLTDTLPSANGTSFWSDATQNPTGDAILANAANTHDLGASAPVGTTLAAPKTNAFVATLTLQIAGNTPVGTYVISLGPSPQGVTAQVSDDANTPNVYDIPLNGGNTYTITIIPEPATWSLIAVGGLGALGLSLLRRRKS
jgi:PEP-CTERM motif-containing protein